MSTDTTTVTFNARSDDPTASLTLRRTFARQFRSRWRDLRGENRRHITQYGSDADAARVLSGWRRWFDQAAASIVTEPAGPAQVSRGRHWTGTHVRQAYQKGLRQAARALRTAGYDTATVETATDPRMDAHREAKAREYHTAYYETEDAVATLRKFLSRDVKTGLQERQSMAAIAATMNETVQSRGENASNALANTVVVETINEARLTSFELAGVEQVGVQVEGATDAPAETVTNRARVNAAGEVEWETAGDRRVCPDCAALEGVTLKIADIRDSPQFRPPLHPSCRCVLSPLPMDDGDDSGS